MSEIDSFLIGEWLFSAIVLLATLVLAFVLRWFLKRLARKKAWRFVQRLTAPLSQVIYVVGLRIFIEAAPLSDKLYSIADKIVYVGAVILVFRLLQRTAVLGLYWSISKLSTGESLEKGFVPLTRNLISVVIFSSAIITVLKYFNYDVMSLVTALGVGSIGLSLAAKDIMAHMISGFVLIIDRNVRPGDRISLQGSVGDVEEIGLRSTQIRTTDGNTLIIPNSELVNTRILNMSVPSREIPSSVWIRIPLDAPFWDIKEGIVELVKKTPGTLSNKQAAVHLSSLAEGLQLIQITFWVTDFTQTARVGTELLEHILHYFRDLNIPLLAPAPSLDSLKK